MSALLIVLLAAIAAIVLVQAGRQARASRRAVQEHHRALDTLGHISSGTAAEPAHMGGTDHEVAHGHVRVVDAEAAPPSSRWARQRARARRASSAAWHATTRQRATPAAPPTSPGLPAATDAAGAGDDSGPTTMEVAMPPSPVRAPLPLSPPLPVPAPPPAVAVPPRPPVVPYQAPVSARHAAQRPVARIDDFVPEEVPPFVPPEPTSHPLAGSPRAPRNHDNTPPPGAQVLDRVPDAITARRKLSLRRRRQSQPSFRRRRGDSRSRSRR